MQLKKIHRAILAELAQYQPGCGPEEIPNVGRGAEGAIYELEREGLVAATGVWEITAAGRDALAQI